jgi:Tfp pilus assembly protein PilN
MNRASGSSVQWPQRRRPRRLTFTLLTWGLASIAICWLLLAGILGLTTLSR